MAMLDDAGTDLRQTIAALRRELDQRTAERDEALAQQVATSEILGVISRSPTDIQPVFDAIVRSAAKVCEAEFSAVARLDDGLLYLAALHSMSPKESAAFYSLFPRTPARNFVMGRALIDARPVHFDDVLTWLDYDARTLEVLQSVARYRSFVAVPIFCEGRAIGVIGCGRREVKPFTTTQIELVKTFADQAAIAIGNVRLFRELETRSRDVSEALEQQTATAEVLQVINSSPGDLALVFDAMLEKAMRLCGAAFGVLHIYDGEYFRATATQGVPEQAARLMHQPHRPPSFVTPLFEGKDLVHIADAAAVARSEDPLRRGSVELGDVRTLIVVPLRKDGVLLGTISVFRQEVRPFTDKQIALLQNFAAQAVIAMENARLLTETREALEQQTATAEVLQVINSSPGDLAPVFDAMLGKAMTLCEAAFGFLNTYDGSRFHRIAERGVPAAFAQFRKEGPATYGPGTFPARLLAGEQVVHVIDAKDEDAYRAGEPNRRALVDLGEARSYLAVALRKDDLFLGTLAVYRQEVRPFSDKQIALVQNFAAQAVIAMENARLITETREALEQQTATAEVLQLINSSPGDLSPVFDAMLERAVRLCDAKIGSLWTYDGEQFRLAAVRGGSQELFDLIARSGPGYDRMSARGHALRGEHVTHVLDARESEAYVSGDPVRRAMVDLGGGRTLVTVSLRKDDAVLGIFTIYRQEVRPFSDKQIALLQNFAAQAVIAMENARLINETREALEQQTATAEVLGVINSSPGDLAPVFEAILDKAHTVCGATLGSLFLFDSELFRAATTHGYPEDLAERLRQGVILSATTQLLDHSVRWVHNPDLTLVDAPTARAVSGRGGVRTNLMLPLRKDGRLLGAISCNRREVRPFTDKEIALLENFAAQAVIAIENARLLTETREALEQQIATSEVLQVINNSQGDLAPVFDAILEKAHSLCDIAQGSLELYDGERFRAVATRGLSDEFAAILRQGAPAADNPATRALVEGSRFTHIRDLAETDYSITRSAAELDAARTLLCVPLRRDGALLGMIASARREVRPFSDKEIALLENFAAQAVIAMENARLINETREALEQQTATAEVLGVINSSPGDLAPVFDAMLEKAMRLCEAAFGQLAVYEEGRFRTAATRGMPAAFVEYRRSNPPDYGPGTQPARLLAGERIIQVADLMAEDVYKTGDPNRRALVDLGGVRSSLMVPLLRDDAVLGFINLYRQEPWPFLRQAGCLAAEFRRPSGDRDGERAPHDRDARGTGAADRNGRGTAGHQFLARRSRAGVRRDAGKSDAAVRRFLRRAAHL